MGYKQWSKPMPNNTQDIYIHKVGKMWEVRVAKRHGAVSRHRTKKNALVVAKREARKRRPSILTIYDQHGRFQDYITYR